MSDYIVILVCSLFLGLALLTWWHSRNVEPAHEYYEEELRDIMGDDEYEAAYGSDDT